MVFNFSYGPENICTRSLDLNGLSRKPSQQLVTFDSEYEYEHHLVTKHLINVDQAHLTSKNKRNSLLSTGAC